MKKNLFAIGLLAISFSVQAQNELLTINPNAQLFVSSTALLYDGGGLLTRGNGTINLRGNMMVVGSANDVIRTVTNNDQPKLDGGNIILHLNNPTDYDNSTYGQLYIGNIGQSNITGIVSKEYRTRKHGISNYYQQIAIPFSGKAVSSLSTELGKTFSTTRYSKNEILTWNNAAVVSNHFTSLATLTSNPTAYYMLGSNNNNLDLATPPANLATFAPTAPGSVYTINGVPYAEMPNAALQNAGNGVNFGTNGNATNQYNEKYNTYLQDQFEGSASAWLGTYGKNIYQFGNPFLTNLDLSRIGITEAAAIGDGNLVSNIWGVRYDPGTVTTLANGTTYSSNALVQTFSAGVPVGDAGLVIKPMQTFVLKLRDNSGQTLNFNTLRRFRSSVRAATTNYSVVAAKNSGTGTVKQLAVIALDATGAELARTYYAVSANMTTGHQTSIATTAQATATSNHIIGTYEEAPAGGWDTNYLSSYWLYINEANENDFLGKNIKLVNYDYGSTNNAVSYKFELRENGETVPAGTHLLSAGIGFYYKTPSGSLVAAADGSTVPITSDVADIYYGQPTNVLATADVVKQSRTVVVYNPEITNYIVRFDPNWKKADIQLYDMSGKLILSKTGVSASQDFVIELDQSLRNSYMVKVVSEKGETVTAKILK